MTRKTAQNAAARIVKPSKPSPVPDFTRYHVVAEAVATLLHPHAEVVLHDLVHDRIAGIWNAFSNRRVGGPSNLFNDPSLRSGDSIIGPYEKAESDGSRIKSISATLTDDVGERTGLLCINFDMSKFDDAVTILRAFTNSSASMPDVLFKGDLREHINLILREELLGLNKSMGTLSKDDRLRIVSRLDSENIFQTRNSVPMVAAALGVGRANLYHMLRTVRAR